MAAAEDTGGEAGGRRGTGGAKPEREALAGAPLRLGAAGAGGGRADAGREVTAGRGLGQALPGSGFPRVRQAAAPSRTRFADRVPGAVRARPEGGRGGLPPRGRARSCGADPGTGVDLE